MRGALMRFATELRVVEVSAERKRGHTELTEHTSRPFRGVIAYAEQWQQLIVPGGVMSSTQPVLVVSSDLTDELGVELTFSHGDLIEGASQKYKVLQQISEGDRFGVCVYMLTEELGA
jgi:hypothetical protein